MNAFTSSDRPMHLWVPLLARTDSGAYLPSLSNALVILSHDPVLAGMLRTDAFRGQPVITRAAPPAYDGAPTLPGPYPRAWQGEDVALIQAHLQRVWSPKFSRMVVEEAMVAEACLRPYHPVVDWLHGLRWDGKPRINTWLRRAFGAPDTPYAEAVGSKFLIAAVRRVRHPGVKFDHLPVLEGGQGIGKSRSLKRLFGEDWFSDSMPQDIAGRDAAMALLGVWCLEFAEIEHLIRAEVETIKAFLSRSTDRYRPPYGKNYVERPRQGVLIGTTNSEDYLRDASGNRRIWPVRCTHADENWIGENRDQLWAEAAAREASGEDIWLSDADVSAEAKLAQRERMAEDVWTERVRGFTSARTRLRIAEVLSECLNIPTERQDRRSEMRVANILRADGWRVKNEWVDGKTTRLWRPSDELE